MTTASPYGSSRRPWPPCLPMTALHHRDPGGPWVSAKAVIAQLIAAMVVPALSIAKTLLTK